MKIAVFGWYGHNNAGDERIKYCLDHFLKQQSGISAVDFYDLHEHAIHGQTDKFDHYDLVIIGGGGIILSQCNYHDFIYGIKTKIATLGISVERRVLSGNTKKFAEALLEKSIAVIVRDEQSKNKMLACGIDKDIKVSGDLTFLEPYVLADAVENNVLGINLLPKPKNFDYSLLSIPMIDWFIRQADRFRLPGFFPTVDFNELLKYLRRDFQLLPIPLYCARQSQDVPLLHKSDVAFLENYFSHVPQDFVGESIDKCRMFLSMRLHGSIFAVQKGVPIVSLAYLPKNYNFMSAAGLSEYVIDDFSQRSLENVLNKIDKEYLSIRQKMHEFCESTRDGIRRDVIATLNLV